MKIIFIANVDLLYDNIININKNIIINNDDIIVRFNNGRDIRLFNSRFNYLITRQGVYGLNGFNIKNNKHDKLIFNKNNSVISIRKRNSNIEIFKKKILKNNDNLKFNDDIILEDYNNINIKGEPSTGFVGFNFFYNKYQNCDEYILIGFDFHENTILKNGRLWNLNSGHDFKSEKKIIENMLKNDKRIKLIKKGNFLTKYF